MCVTIAQMIWEQGTTLIVMLTDLVEDGKVMDCTLSSSYHIITSLLYRCNVVDTGQNLRWLQSMAHLS